MSLRVKYFSTIILTIVNSSNFHSGVPDAPHAVNDVSLLAEGNSVGESSLPSVIVNCDDRDNTFKTTNEVLT